MRRLFVLALVALTATACSSDSPTDPLGSIAGTYTLRTVNGATLPFIYDQNGTDTAELLDDAITIVDGGTWSEVWHERITLSGTATTYAYSDAGTYTRNGNLVTLTSPQTGSLQMTAGTGTLTISVPGIVAIYQQ